MDEQRGKAGVDGWLAVFLLVIGVGLPLVYAAFLNHDVRLQQLYWQVRGEEVAFRFVLQMWIVALARIGISIGIAIGMMRVRRWQMVRFAIAGLWVLALAIPLLNLAFAWLPVATELFVEALRYAIPHLAGGCFLAFAGTVYLYNSRRVAATYARAEHEALAATFE